MKAHAIHGWVSGLFKQLPRPIRIVVVMRNIAVVRPTLGRKEAVSGPRKVAQQVVDHRCPVDGIRHRLPDPHIFENRIPSVECYISQHRARSVYHLKIRFAFERQHHVAG